MNKQLPPLKFHLLFINFFSLVYGVNRIRSNDHSEILSFPGLALGMVSIFLMLTPTSLGNTMLTAQAPITKAESAAVALQLGAKVEREVSGGEQQVFAIEVDDKQFVRVVIDQRRMLLTIKVVSPKGSTIFEGLTQNTISEVSRFSFIAEESGIYTIEVGDPKKATAKRSFTILLEELRESKPEDQDRTQADRLSMEAGSLIATMSANNLRAASDKYRSALALWRRVGARYEIAQTLLTLGSIAHNLSNLKEAVDSYHQALPLWRSLNDRAKEAQTLTALGWTYFGAGDFSHALENYNQALPIRRELNDLRGQAQTLTTLGQVYGALGEPELAIENYTQALDLARQGGDRLQEAFALNSFAYLYSQLGEFQKAINCLEAALPLWLQTGNRYGEADADNSYGVTCDRLGDFDQALTYYKRALKIWQFLGNRGGEADALNNIGVGILNQAILQVDKPLLNKALDYLNRALTIRRAIGQKLGEDSTLVSIGVAYQGLERTAEASQYFKEILDKDPNHPFALHNMGFNYYLEGDFRRAEEYEKRALLGFRQRGNRDGEALALRLLAASQDALGDLLEARENGRRALDIIEASRSRIMNQESRMLFRERRSDYPNVLITTLGKLNRLYPDKGYDVEAFQVSESARARGLLEVLLKAQVDLTKGVDQQALARERGLELQLTAKEQYRSRLIASDGQEETLAKLETEIASLTNQYQVARNRLLSSSPKYAGLIEPKALSVEETQALIDSDTLLLEYRLGNSASYLWAVSSDSFGMYMLPESKVVQTKARRVYDLMTARNVQLPDETVPARAARVLRADAEFQDAAADLSNILLGPISSKLTKRRIVIVSEGLLQLVPFSALPVPGNASRTPARSSSKYELLIANHEIVTLPSASVLAVLRRETETREAPPKAVAVFADPVYGTDDPRIRSLPAEKEQDDQKNNGNTMTDSNADREPGSSEPSYRRLRFSRDEANNIVALVPRNSAFEALDFVASRKTVLTADLSQYRIIHFATHGFLDTERPELSGLALSFMTEDGHRLDGYLKLSDIYGLRLNADLVVLSGCQTALGKDLRGEGLIGLTRGFMNAGVPRVIASLWSVDDRATSELMKRFYRAVLIEHLRPAEALRVAQKSLYRERGWTSPYYWAAFTFQGEWK